MLSNCGSGEDSWESLEARRSNQSILKETLNTQWKDWCWSWSSNILATWCKEPTHWKRPWRWGRLKAGGEGGDRGWDGWMASPIQWTWFWVNSRSWWWTERPGVLQSMGSKRVRHAWKTEQQQHSSEQVRDLTPQNSKAHALSQFVCFFQGSWTPSPWESGEV